MKPFSDQVAQRLQQLARIGQAIDTDQAKDAVGMNAQQFQRMATQNSPQFPPRERIGRKWYVNPSQLLQFVLDWNALIRGLSISGVAVLIHSTVATARRLSGADGFPPPLGKINGRERWARTAVVEWQRQRLGGSKLPPAADVPPDGNGGKRKPGGRAHGHAKKK